MEEQDDVMDFLAPWLERIHVPFHRAMAMYTDDYLDRVRAEHSDSAAAHNVHCHVVAEFEREFADEPGFNFLKVKGLQVLNIHDAICARWKKVDEEGLHRNHFSQQQHDFDRQLQLPGLPPQALRVTFGYEPDLAFSYCERVMVARPQGKSIVWAAQVLEEDGKVVWQDITPKRLTGTEAVTSGIRFKRPGI